MGLFDKVKALWESRKVLAPLGEAVMEIKASAVKDGWKTTEFWGKTIFQALTVLAVFRPELKLDPGLAFQIVGIAETFYHAFRMIAKANPPTTVTVTPVPTVTVAATATSGAAAVLTPLP